MRKLLKKQGWEPTWIVTDELRSYHVAFKSIGLSGEHMDNKRTNNRDEAFDEWKSASAAA